MKSPAQHGTNVVKLMRMTPDVKRARAKPFGYTTGKHAHACNESQGLPDIPRGSNFLACPGPANLTRSVQQRQHGREREQPKDTSPKRPPLAAPTARVEEGDGGGGGRGEAQTPVDALHGRSAVEGVVRQRCAPAQDEHADAEDIHGAPEVVDPVRVAPQRVECGAQPEADGR